jgi:hypothetical protein
LQNHEANWLKFQSNSPLILQFLVNYPLWRISWSITPALWRGTTLAGATYAVNNHVIAIDGINGTRDIWRALLFSKKNLHKKCKNDKILKDDGIWSHSFMKIIGGSECKQWWKFILVILLKLFLTKSFSQNIIDKHDN